jgi:hypothetical protein
MSKQKGPPTPMVRIGIGFSQLRNLDPTMYTIKLTGNGRDVYIDISKLGCICRWKMCMVLFQSNRAEQDFCGFFVCAKRLCYAHDDSDDHVIIFIIIPPNMLLFRNLFRLY